MLLSPTPCFKYIVHFFFSGAAQCVYRSIAHYFVYPSTHMPYSINSNSIMPVVLARGTISVSGLGGKNLYVSGTAGTLGGKLVLSEGRVYSYLTGMEGYLPSVIRYLCMEM